MMTEEDKEEGAIESFFRQLWWVPLSLPPRVIQLPPKLFWVRANLWAAKSFRVNNLHPVQPVDIFDQDSKICTFASEIWGKGEHESFDQVLKNSMAGRATQGRVRGHGGREEFWNEQGWWNPNYPLHPGFPPPQFQPQYGFYPTPPSPPMHMPLQGPPFVGPNLGQMRQHNF
jgi:hypothetical protein